MLYEQYFIDDLKDPADLVGMINPFRFCAIALLLLVFNVAILAQESPKAVLVDEFGNISCEDLLARNDYFLTQLSNNPQDVGYAIIYANGRNPKAFLRYVEASLFTRQCDRSRIKIILVSNGNNGDVVGAFWRVPPGAPAPVYDRVEVPGPDLAKSFIVGRTFTENVCPSFSPDLYAKLVLDNPGSLARVVISGPSVRWRLSAAREELEMLRRYTKLPRNRIKFYFVHTNDDSNATNEYWYIPRKKR
ncbi:MAG: hypothetical protein ABJB34_10245 [Acidobacteriota bacterium]